MYFAVRGISSKFSLYEQITLSAAHERKEEELTINKEQ
jgi:hypothetical protein